MNNVSSLSSRVSTDPAGSAAHPVALSLVARIKSAIGGLFSRLFAWFFSKPMSDREVIDLTDSKYDDEIVALFGCPVGLRTFTDIDHYLKMGHLVGASDAIKIRNLDVAHRIAVGTLVSNNKEFKEKVRERAYAFIKEKCAQLKDNITQEKVDELMPYYQAGIQIILSEFSEGLQGDRSASCYDKIRTPKLNQAVRRDIAQEAIESLGQERVLHQFSRDLKPLHARFEILMEQGGNQTLLYTPPPESSKSKTADEIDRFSENAAKALNTLSQKAGIKDPFFLQSIMTQTTLAYPTLVIEEMVSDRIGVALDMDSAIANFNFPQEALLVKAHLAIDGSVESIEYTVKIAHTVREIISPVEQGSARSHGVFTFDLTFTIFPKTEQMELTRLDQIQWALRKEKAPVVPQTPIVPQAVVVEGEMPVKQSLCTSMLGSVADVASRVLVWGVGRLPRLVGAI